MNSGSHYSIGDTCLVGDGTHSKIARRDTGVLYLSARNFKDGRLDLTKVFYIAEADYAKHFLGSGRALTRSEPGDLVFSIIGSLGEPYLVQKGDRFGISSSVAIVRPKTDLVDPRFLLYWVKGPVFQNAIVAIKGGVAQSYISLEMIRSLPFPRMSLSAQRRIANILSAYDNLIESSTRRIAILEEMAMRIFEEWFIRFRAPGCNSSAMVDTPLGRFPKQWKVVPIDALCSRVTDGAHKSPPSIDAGVPMASVKDMRDWDFDLNGCRAISREHYEDLVRNDCKPLIGDILIAKDGSYLKHVFLVRQERELAILSSIAILRPNGRMRPNLFIQFLRDPNITQRMKGIVSGVAIPRIILKDFKTFLMPFPPEELQDAWEGIVGPMHQLCWQLYQTNFNLRAQRDLLLPKLISGEIDVSRAESVMEAAE